MVRPVRIRPKVVLTASILRSCGTFGTFRRSIGPTCRNIDYQVLRRIMLIIFGGLPGVGKTTLARRLSRELSAVHLRIDTIEMAIWRSRVHEDRDLDDVGYQVAYGIAADNLRLGHTVIADSVNPVAASRAAWRAVGQAVPVPACEVEVICSDISEHRRRVERREADLPGFMPPTWDEVCSRVYEPWQSHHIVIDTAARTLEQTLSDIRGRLAF
jgi:predicted kinase